MTNIAALPEHDRYVATLAERAEQRLQEQRQAAEPQPTAEQLIDRYGPALVLEAAAMIAELAQAGSDVGGGGGGAPAVDPVVATAEDWGERHGVSLTPGAPQPGQVVTAVIDPEQVAQVGSVVVLAPDGLVRESLASDPFAESATADPEQSAGDTLGEARVLDRYAAVYPTREDG